MPPCRRHSRGLYDTALLALLLCVAVPSPLLPSLSLVQAQTCPSRIPAEATPTTAPVTRHGALEPLLSSAKSSREAILSDELPYGTIRAEIRKHYNTSSLPVSPFVVEWIKYSENALYLAGFIVFVGVVFPVVMVALWTSWEYCYETDNETEDDCRNESRSAQIIAWNLAVATVLLILVLVAFVGILLAGSGLISRGVTEGGGAVSRVLPEVALVRDRAVKEVRDVTIVAYDDLLERFYASVRDIPGPIEASVNESTRPGLFYANVSGTLSQLLSHSQLLLDHTHNLTVAADTSSAESSPESQFLEDLDLILNDLVTLCSEFLDRDNSSDLAMECEDLVGPQGETYIPTLSSNISNLGGRSSEGVLLLQELEETLSDEAQLVGNVFTSYFKELSQNLTQLADVAVTIYYGKNSSFYSNLTSVVQDILALNSSLSLGLPASQEQVMTFLGPRYLANWDEFRHLCTVAFALIILFLGACLVVAMGRGLLNIYDIYIHGEETSSKEGAHQSGTMMKKLAFMLTGVSAVSAMSYGVTLVLAGGMGQSCAPNGNFSELLRQVIDNNLTWNRTYLLGQAVLKNASYPLTFGNVLERCRLNSSLYMTLELENILDLEQDIHISAADQASFLTSLRNISETISPFPPLMLELLRDAESLPVRWDDFTSLSLDNGLFDASFVGLDRLSRKMLTMQQAAANSPPSNFTSLLEQASSSLSTLTTHFNTTLLPEIRNSARYLQESLGHAPSSALSNASKVLQGTVTIEVDQETNICLTRAATVINHQIAMFISATINTLRCETGSCHALFDLYTQFSAAVCHSVVPGLDIYWASLLAILCMTLSIMALSLVLASRFVDFKQDRTNKFHLIGSGVRQARGLFWFLLGVSVNTWLVVAIATDDYFHEVFCESGSSNGCCPVCVWAIGIVFLVLSVVVGGVSRVYQCAILHRLSKGIKKVRRYWMDKKKAAQFHSQLAVLFMQDIPFLIIAGIYTSGIGTLTAPSFFSLTLSLLGIISYLFYIFRELKGILGYCACLVGVFKQSSKFDLQGELPGVGGGGGGGGHGSAVGGSQGMPMNRRAMNGRYIGSESEHSESDSQETTQHVDDWMYNPNNPGGHVDHRLSVIPEHIEMPPRQHGGERSSPPVVPLGRGTRGVGRGGIHFSVPVYMHAQDSDSETAPSASMHLDHMSSPTESAIRQRRDAANHGSEGIEVASSIRHCDTSSASYFGSKTSVMGSDIQGYYSSSLPPDEMYDSSDDREDYDSDYSHTNAQRSKLRLQLNGLPYYEMSVEV